VSAKDIPFGDDRPLPPPLTEDELALARQARLATANGHTADPDATTNTWQPENLIQLAANPPAPPTIGGLLYPAKRTVLSGETESMKTWLALILCKAELDIGLTVAWVDLDAMGPGALLNRLRLLGVDDQAIADRFLYYEPDKPLNKDTYTQPIADLIEERAIRLCVIDAFNPILSMHALDPNSTTDVERFWQLYADPIADAGAAPTLLDHVVKNAETRGKYAYGSERKASGAIVHIGFQPLEMLTQGGRGRSVLNVHKDRPGYLQRPSIGRLVIDASTQPFTYHIEPDKSHDQEGGFRPTTLMEKVSRQLERETHPLSTKQIEEVKLGKADYVRKALTSLTEDGYIRRDEGPRGAILYSSIRPFREADSPAKTTSSPPRPHLVPNLASLHVVPRPPPYGDEDDDRRRPGTTPDLVPPPDGTPIHEYEFPPIDEGQADDIQDEDLPWYKR